jgi:rhamnulose-1-phosphate aldolase
LSWSHCSRSAVAIDIALPLEDLIDTIAATSFSIKAFKRLASTPLQLDRILHQVGQVGKRLSDIGSAEGAAGNISVCIRNPLDVNVLFPQLQMIQLPQPAPQLAGASIIVSGSGCRLRDIAEQPITNLACVLVESDGQNGRMFTSPSRQFERVTSEFNSHLAVHVAEMSARNIQLHTVLHGQPLHLTYLSHIPRYQDWRYLNQHLLRWQPETIINFPEGIGVLPFIMPGSQEQTTETVRILRAHKMLVWSQHGVMARADNSILHALDLIEYAETAAHYEYLNLLADEKSQGLTPQQIRSICEFWNIQQSVF